MKENEKKVNKTEENGIKLTDEQLSEISGGKENAHGSETSSAMRCDSSFEGLK
ncbi:MAG: hypothetical protein KBS52_05485 [Clostridiales bacterium]|nr:hypothetical protein [Candidatus Equinaster intestinalis]